MTDTTYYRGKFHTSIQYPESGIGPIDHAAQKHTFNSAIIDRVSRKETGMTRRAFIFFSAGIVFMSAPAVLARDVQARLLS
jgi:predicted O-linked N-acetylglucosamine transferase (SPINDLY family)